MSKNYVLLAVLVLLVCLLPMCLQARHFARWYTTMGNFTSDLRDEIVPITANNFIDLTNAGFYDGLHFHRVVHGFVIQDGDPLGTGYGGPGYTIPDEFSPLLHHDSAGVLAMAHTSQPNSAGSQYYITLAPTPNLDGAYAVFGKVFEGLDVVLNIGNVAVDANSHPITNVNIDSLRILGLVINNVSPTADSVVAVENGAEPTSFVVEAYDLYTQVEYEWFVDDVEVEGATDFILEYSFPTGGTHNVKCVTSDEQISWATIWQVDVLSANSDNVIPQSARSINLAGFYPNPFSSIFTVNYKLSKATPVNVSVYDVKGRRVYSQTVNTAKAGYNQWQWQETSDNGTKPANGIYFIELNDGSSKVTCKAVLIR